jgi:hypothetical protein
MSKSKRGHSTKARCVAKVRAEAAGRKSGGRHSKRANSKQARVLELLRRPGGARAKHRRLPELEGSRCLQAEPRARAA